MERSVAYHEAGHALVMMALVGSFHTVSIEPEPRSLGRMKPFSDADRARLDGDAEALAAPLQATTARILVTIACGGAAAELAAFGYAEWAGCGADFEQVDRLVCQIAADERQAVFSTPTYDDDLGLAPTPLEVWHHTVKDAASWFAEPDQRRQLDALATALMDRKTLTFAEAKAAAQTAAGG